MMLIYVVYCIALHFNSALERWAYNVIKLVPIKLPTKEEQSALVTFKNTPDSTTYTQSQSAAAVTNVDETATAGGVYQDYSETKNDASWDPNAAWDDSAPAVPAAPPAARAPASAAANASWDPNDSWNADSGTATNYGYASGTGDPTPGADTPPPVPKAIATTTAPTASSGLAGQPEYYRSKEVNPLELKNPLDRPPPEAGLFAMISWRVVYPIHYMCRLTVPDCRTEKYRNWHAFTFLVSMVWISFYSYIMVGTVDMGILIGLMNISIYVLLLFV